MALFHTDNPSNYNPVQLLEESDFIIGGAAGTDNRALKTLADRTAYLKKNNAVILSGSGIPDENSIDSLTIDSNSINNTYYIDLTNQDMYKLTSGDPVVWTVVITEPTKDVEEVTTDIEVENNKIYYTNNSDRTIFSIPSNANSSFNFEIHGTDSFGFTINGNHILNGSKRKLLSSSIYDKIKLTVIDTISSVPRTTINFENINLQNIHKYSFFCGGELTGGVITNVIDYILADSILVVNASDRGDLFNYIKDASAFASTQYSFVAGGDTTGANPQNVIQYFDNTIITTGNATTSGILGSVTRHCCGFSGIQYGFIYGGDNGSVDLSLMNYIDVTLLNTNAEYVDIITVGSNPTAASGTQYSIIITQSTFFQYDMIALIDVFEDRGAASLAQNAALSNTQYAFFCGGFGSINYDAIYYTPMTLFTINASNRGVLPRATLNAAGTSGVQYGFVGGGDDNGAPITLYNYIESIDMIVLTGNSSDRGDLSAAKTFLMGC